MKIDNFNFFILICFYIVLISIITPVYSDSNISKSIGSPVADFTSTLSSGTAPFSTQFIDRSGNNVAKWLWDFGDGTTSTIQNPSHVYSKIGVYTVTLTVSNSVSSDSKIITEYIAVFGPNGEYPNTPPKVPASPPPITPTPQPITLTITTPVPTPSPSPPTRIVTQSVTPQPITNSQTPIGFINSDFKWSAISGSSSLKVQFTDLSQNNPIKWEWNFGDGSSTSEQNPIHTYPHAGQFTVTLTASYPGLHGAISQHEISVPILPIGGKDQTTPTTMVPVSVTSDNGGGFPINWDFLKLLLPLIFFIIIIYFVINKEKPAVIRLTQIFRENPIIIKEPDEQKIKIIINDKPDIKPNIQNIIKKLKNEERYILIENFVKQYDDNSHLTELLELLNHNYTFIINRWELEEVITYAREEKEYYEFKNAILSSKPQTNEEVIREFLQYYGENYSIHISLLERFLVEERNYKGTLDEDISYVYKKIQLEKFERTLMLGPKKSLDIKDIDKMHGYSFEAFLGKLFTNMGYNVTNTPLSNDQGADLIIKKFGEVTVVQAKHWKNPVNNKAVQEVCGAINFYQAQKGMVVTNSTFTPSAKELAERNDVELVDREKLIQYLKDYPTT